MTFGDIVPRLRSLTRQPIAGLGAGNSVRVLRILRRNFFAQVTFELGAGSCCWNGRQRSGVGLGSPVVNFINILRTILWYKSDLRSFFHLHVTRKKLPKRLLFEKCASKMLRKLTPGAKPYEPSCPVGVKFKIQILRQPCLKS